MPPELSMRRIMLFVDGTNLTRGAREFSRRLREQDGGSPGELRIDVIKLVEVVPRRLGGGSVVGGYYFSGFQRQNAAETDKLRARITQAGLSPVQYPVTVRPASCPECKRRLSCSNPDCQFHHGEVPDFREKFVDVDLALHAYKEHTRYDLACIVSGDGDFLPLVKLLHQAGKEVRILAFSWKIHQIYRSYSDLTVALDEWVSELATSSRAEFLLSELTTI